jgi:hypothetical protein
MTGRPQTARLDSVLAKIERAQEHARLLDHEFEAWRQQDPYGIAQQVNRDLTRHSLVIAIKTPPPLQRWSLLLGDAIHNLRSALDHLVYAISVHELQADPPPNGAHCAFVIADTRREFRARRRRIEALSLPVQQAIADVQPYQRQHVSMPPLLALLRDFDDADKHQLIAVVLQRPAAFHLSVSGPGLRLEDHRVDSPFVDLVDGAEIAWVTCTRPTPHLHFNGSVAVAIVVKHAPGPGPGIERTGVVALLLEDLLPEVREVVRIVSAAVTS